MFKVPSIRCQTCGHRKESVFCDLSAEHLQEIDKAKTTNHYKRQQIIFYEGNQPYGLYCICSGKIKVFKVDEQGHQQIVRLAGPGDILGIFRVNMERFCDFTVKPDCGAERLVKIIIPEV